jgi:hypothetical protein
MAAARVCVCVCVCVCGVAELRAAGQAQQQVTRYEVHVQVRSTDNSAPLNWQQRPAQLTVRCTCRATRRPTVVMAKRGAFATSRG